MPAGVEAGPEAHARDSKRPAITTSIGQRITALWIALFTLLLMLYASLSSFAIRQHAQQTLDTELFSQAALAATGLESARHFDQDVPVLHIPGFGLVLYKSERPVDFLGVRPPPGVVAQGVKAVPNKAESVAGNPEYRLVLHRAEESLSVAAFAFEAPVPEEQRRVWTSYALTVSPVLFLALLGGSILARRSLLPIDRMVRTAARVAQSGDLSLRFSERQNDEMGRLARTFNTMLAEIEASFQRERSFIGNVSHELRQPLSAIIGESDLLLSRDRSPQEFEAALRTIRTRAQKLADTVNDMLLLARSDAKALSFNASVDVNEAVVAACLPPSKRYPEVSVEFLLCDQPLKVNISKVLFERLVNNIAINGLSAARSRLCIRTQEKDGTAQILVEDDGLGIKAQQRERIFERFVREDRARPGSGLGLPIARAIAEAVGGHITVLDSVLGGACFCIELPTTG